MANITMSVEQITEIVSKLLEIDEFKKFIN